LAATSHGLKFFCCRLPIKTTSTAQYAAVAPKTSCLLAVVHKEIAVAKAKANVRVIDAIALVDRGTEENIYIGIRSRAVEATAMMILINTPRRLAE
jgi:hypothetical protein